MVGIEGGHRKHMTVTPETRARIRVPWLDNEKGNKSTLGKVRKGHGFC